MTSTRAHCSILEAQQRLHIVGCAPRSGTTLMTELMINGFEIDGYTAHETSIFRKPEQSFRVFCSKRPHDISVVRPLLALDHNLWVIYMLRDPRDVIVSRHRQDPHTYFTNLRVWQEYASVGRKLADHPHFLTVRYEDLVADADAIQEWLATRMPFLVKRSSFSDYHRIARPSELSQKALRGLRPVSARSIGAWRQHKARIAGQLALHGSISEELIQLGYETNDAWLDELKGIEADLTPSRMPEFIPRSERLRRAWRRLANTIRYATGMSHRLSAVQSPPR